MKSMNIASTFAQERIHINVARVRKGGEVFEVVIDPDAAIALKESGATSVDNVDTVVKAQKIFADAKKGMLASEQHMQTLFGTVDFEQVAKKILLEGEIQLTAEHREKVREAKRKTLVARIHRNAIDPKTGNPHPEKRIELAFEEAKIKVDELRTVDQQLQDVVRKLQVVLPLKFETAHLVVRVPAHSAAKLYGEVQRLAKIVRADWLDDGSLHAEVELPAGLKTEFTDALNSHSHGSVTVEEQKRR